MTPTVFFSHVKSFPGTFLCVRVALNLLLNLKTRGFGNSLIAREIALDLALANYKPQVVSHVPGMANQAADELSRIPKPGGEYRIPEHLLHVHRDWWPKPHKQIFRTLAATPRCILP